MASNCTEHIEELWGQYSVGNCTEHIEELWGQYSVGNCPLFPTLCIYQHQIGNKTLLGPHTNLTTGLGQHTGM